MIHIATVRVFLNFTSDTEFQPWLGPELRGNFGNALKLLSCREAGGVSRIECSRCRYNRTCAYGYLFRTPVPSIALNKGVTTNAPHPFFFRLPPPAAVRWNREIEIDLVLVGKGMEYIPYFFDALQLVGRRGIGANRSCFELLRAQCLRSGLALDMESPTGSELRFGLDLDNSTGPQADEDGRLKIRFQTPLRMKRVKRRRSFRFHPFVSSAIVRLEALGLWHCGIDLRGRFAHLLPLADQVRVVDDQASFVDLWRYGYNGRSVPVGGLVGEVVVQGELEPFRGILNAAAYIGVGGKTAYGLGHVDFLTP